MTPEDNTSNQDGISPAEQAALEGQWESGSLAHHHEQVLRFISEQCQDILRLAGDKPDAVALVKATQELIATLRTIHHQSEMQAQMREIHNEIWYCGQRGEFDTQRIKRDWVERYGPSWRRWRIKEYQFVASRCAAEICAAANRT